MSPPGLPAQLTSLIGRERDVEEVAASLASTRLLTLTGAGGVGKTRLALAAAARAAAGFPDGSWWIELAAVVDTGAVAPALARALGVRALPGLSELDAVVGYLCRRRALLVLDNCEHLSEEVARVGAAVLRACPSVTILATSRAPLAICGETRWAVSPLSLPSGDGRMELLGSDAARLFIDRVRRVDRRWSLTGANAGAIAEICRQLDGVPLALELAAARVSVMAPADIARGLDDALGLLSARSCVADARHQTLRASLDWSYGLLPADTRRLLRRLGVFADGATLEFARLVCCGDGLARGRILAALATLVEHSWVRVDQRGASVRYRLLETVRQYALGRLRDAGEGDSVRDRHRDAFLAFAELQGRKALTPGQPRVFAALDAESVNLEAALDRALATDREAALRACLALQFWWRARARFRGASGAFEGALEANGLSGGVKASALAAWAWTVGAGGDFGRANELAADAAARADASGDEGAVAVALLVRANHRFFTDPMDAVGALRRCRELACAVDDEYLIGRSEALLRGVAWFQQDAQGCRAGFDELRRRLERLGDRETLAWFWFEQGAVCYPLGEHEHAARLLARAVAVAGEVGEATADRAARSYLALLDLAIGDAQNALDAMLAIQAQTLLHGGSFALPWIELLVAQAEAGSDRLQAACARLANLVALDAWGAAHARTWAQAELAEVLRLLGRDDEATRHGTGAVESARALRNTWLEAKAQLTLGRLAAAHDRATDAERLHHAALDAIQERGYRLELPVALEALADVAARRERLTDAARMLGAAERVRRQLGFVAWPSQRSALAELTARVADALGPAALERALTDGGALEPDRAVAWVRRARGERKRPKHGWESLTPTELEVVRQVAAGLTNPQIAERLFVTRATVKTHLSHVYAKLDLRNRSQLAAAAAGRLVPEK
jgi:predicted ATPase/DNA-binding CsgD family transcriptional regulator